MPAGKRIDTSDMESWVFPVGTRAWKEFSFVLPGSDQLRRIETRLIEKVAPGQWRFYSYLWNDDETEARLAPEEGIKDAVTIAPGVTYDIPNRRMCMACHNAAIRDREALVGFDALQLSPKRDPRALHKDLELQTEGITLETLVRAKRISHRPTRWPEIEASELQPERTRVFGYFHGNCASCHNPTGAAAPTGLFLRYNWLTRAFEDSIPYRTTVNVATTKFKIPGQRPGDSYRLRPGQPNSSAILFRMIASAHRMPPMATKVIDREAARAVQSYILSPCRGKDKRSGCPPLR